MTETAMITDMTTVTFHHSDGMMQDTRQRPSLTADDRDRIRAMHGAGRSLAEVAAVFGVTRQTVHFHVMDAAKREARRRSQNSKHSPKRT